MQVRTRSVLFSVQVAADRPLFPLYASSKERSTVTAPQGATDVRAYIPAEHTVLRVEDGQVLVHHSL
jgi:hypothetical protein